MTAAEQPAGALGDAVAAAVRESSELAGYIRDARSVDDPCPHWVGQAMAVCSPCLRDRIAPHVAQAIAARLAAVPAAVDERAGGDQRPEGLREVVRYYGASEVLEAVLGMAAEIYGEDRAHEKTAELLNNTATPPTQERPGD